MGGTGEKGLDFQDVYWLILWSLRQLVDGSSAKYCAQITQVLSHELYLSPSPPIIDMMWEIWTVQWRGCCLWLRYKDVASKRQQEMPLVRCFYTAQTDQQELVLSSSILWLRDPYLSFFSSLSYRLQWSCTDLLRQDSATAPSFCSYGNLFEPSGSNFLMFIFLFSVNFYVVVWSNRLKNWHTRKMQVSQGGWTGPAHLTGYIIF